MDVIACNQVKCTTIQTSPSVPMSLPTFLFCSVSIT